MAQMAEEPTGRWRRFRRRVASLVRRSHGAPAQEGPPADDPLVERVIDDKTYKVSAQEFRSLLAHQQRYELRQQWFTLASASLPYLVPFLLVLVGATLALTNRAGLAAYALLSAGGLTGTGVAIAAKIKGQGTVGGGQ